MIKGIVFDLDGVYFKNGKTNFIRNVSEKFNLDKNIVADFFLKSDLMTKYKKGEIEGDEFWKNAIKIWNINSTPEEIISILKKGYEINESAKKLIQDIRNKGFKTIICSNNFPERIRVLNERFNFLREFDFVILSYEYNLLKPELFKKISEVTNFSQEEVIIIDDSPDLINKAKELGFKTILCDNPNRISNELKVFLPLDTLF
jgi:putative hydrolase of the HAD superfamily|tara:strand:- start:111 stop:719 length:609 start_codon:yes stop_codon:yes gene_type:complete